MAVSNAQNIAKGYLSLPEGFWPTQLKCGYCHSNVLDLRSEALPGYVVKEWLSYHHNCKRRAEKAKEAGWKE